MSSTRRRIDYRDRERKKSPGDYGTHDRDRGRYKSRYHEEVSTPHGRDSRRSASIDPFSRHHESRSSRHEYSKDRFSTRSRSPRYSYSRSRSSSKSLDYTRNRRHRRDDYLCSDRHPHDSTNLRCRLDTPERRTRGSAEYGLPVHDPRGVTDKNPKRKIGLHSRANREPSRSPESSVRSSSQSSERTESSSGEFDKSGDVQLKTDVLKIIGEDSSKINVTSGNVHNVLSKNWSDILTKGTSKEIIEELIKKYPPPENFQSLKAPILNPEVRHTMSDASRTKDTHQVTAQIKVDAAIYANGLALTKMFNDGGEVDPLLVTYLCDSARLMSDVHYNISITRRAFITPNVNQMVTDVVTDLPIESHLFGEKLSERIKAAEDIQKQSKTLIKPRAPSNRGGTLTNRSSMRFQRTQLTNQSKSYRPQSFQGKSLNSTGPSRGNRGSFRGRQDGQRYRAQKNRHQY